MTYLEMISPSLGRVRFPLSRDQVFLLMAAVNEFFLGLDIYLAHSISGTIVPNEWIPIIFGPIAGMFLLLSGLLALRYRTLANIIASFVLLASIAVGLLGAYFHLVRAILPTGPIGQRVTVNLFVWAPPILGPLTFSLVGLFGISAAWEEDPPGSGRLILFRDWKLHLPYSKSQAYFFMIGLGTLATLISSVLDHARTGFTNPWLWVPTAIGSFSAAVAIFLGILDQPSKGDLFVYLLAMMLLIIVGVIGLLLHIEENLIASGTFVIERFIRGSPFLAPLLFSDMGALGLVVLIGTKSGSLE